MKGFKISANVAVAVMMLVFVSGCNSSDKKDDEPAYKFSIEGRETVTDRYDSEFKVSGVPSTGSVNWSVDNDRFEVSRNGYNSALVKATASGEEAQLKAVVTDKGEIVGECSKKIRSAF